VTIERQIVRGLAGALGCEGFSGSLCGGGSMANLMGLAMAREAQLPANESGAQPGVVYASSEVHMSIPKAMALLGLGRENLRLIGTDEGYRLDPQALRTAIAADCCAGRKPLAVVATRVPSTRARSIRCPTSPRCVANSSWLHVDGAYRALAALAIPNTTGLSAADSRRSILTSGYTSRSTAACAVQGAQAARTGAFSHRRLCEVARTGPLRPSRSSTRLELHRFRALVMVVAGLSRACGVSQRDPHRPRHAELPGSSAVRKRSNCSRGAQRRKLLLPA
jgi:hypothetical protein